MDFLTKKDTIQKAALKAFGFAFLPLSLAFLMSGCTQQTTSIQNSQSSLLAQPVMNQKLSEEDFAFPSQPPSLLRGKTIFQQQCMQCHVQGFWQTQKVKEDLAYTTPIDLYLMLSTGKAPKVVMPTAQRRQLLPANHPSIKLATSRDDRWAVIFYTRYLAGAADIQSPDPKTTVDAIFGGNCAVCHGSKGQGDGPLYTGRTANHELHNAPQPNNLLPQPANFVSYSRLYNRTDAQLVHYICEGIYPTAMPSWYGDVNIDKDTGKITYAFDEHLIFNVMRYVRSLSYKNDLSAAEISSPPPGLQDLHSCMPVASNRPWTQRMQTEGPAKDQPFTVPPANPITGGMVHVVAPPTKPAPNEGGV